MRSNQDQQLVALEKKFGTNLGWIKLQVPMTHYEVEKYFGPECEEYEPICACCCAWKQWHSDNQVVSVYLSRDAIIECLDR